MKQIRIILAAALLWLAVLPAHAYTANDGAKTVATTGTFLDTSNAVAYAKAKNQDGWLVTVAGGVHVWTNATLLLDTTNQFTLAGSGTTIRWDNTNTVDNSYGLYVASENFITVTNFNFGTTNHQMWNAIACLDGSGLCFRMTACNFQGSSAQAFALQVGSINSRTNYGPFGLIDHCSFTAPAGAAYNFVNIRANGANVNAGWQQPMSWGTANSVVVEDCSFKVATTAILAAAVEAAAGARITLRNCAITNLTVSVHGRQSGEAESALQMECYNNHFEVDSDANTLAYLFWLRGGSCVVYSNTINVIQYGLAKVFYLSVECASTVWASEFCASKLLYPADYPALQQVGQGSAGSSPCYFWSNQSPWATYGDFTDHFGIDDDAPFIVQGRDVFTNTVKPSYTALAYPYAGTNQITITTNPPPAPETGTTNGPVYYLVTGAGSAQFNSLYAYSGGSGGFTWFTATNNSNLKLRISSSGCALMTSYPPAIYYQNNSTNPVAASWRVYRNGGLPTPTVTKIQATNFVNLPNTFTNAVAIIGGVSVLIPQLPLTNVVNETDMFAIATTGSTTNTRSVTAATLRATLGGTGSGNSNALTLAQSNTLAAAVTNGADAKLKSLISTNSVTIPNVLSVDNTFLYYGKSGAFWNFYVNNVGQFGGNQLNIAGNNFQVLSNGNVSFVGSISGNGGGLTNIAITNIIFSSSTLLDSGFGVTICAVSETNVYNPFRGTISTTIATPALVGHTSIGIPKTITGVYLACHYPPIGPSTNIIFDITQNEIVVATVTLQGPVIGTGAYPPTATNVAFNVPLSGGTNIVHVRLRNSSASMIEDVRLVWTAYGT